MLIRNCRHLARTARFQRSQLLFNNHYQFPFHNGHISSTLLLRFSSHDRSKIEDTIRMLKDDLESQQKQKDEEKRMQLVKKPPLSMRIMKYVKNPKELLLLIWHGIMHTFHGFRLFALETRLSMKYVLKLLRGQSLNRKERQQLVRTSADLFRLVPFSIFVIVPFMELLFPLYIKLFPQMMPSTFQDVSKEEQKHLKQIKAKIETAKFLQDTLEEIALIRKKPDELESSKAFEFSQFLKKVREEGGYVTNADLFKFIKLFEDELTLDNLAMSQLRGLCRLLGISKLGTPEILRFRLQMRLRELKADDKMIAAEGGADVLSVQELQSACRARGMRAIGVSEERLRNQLKQWLELSLNDQVPPSLLLLSRAMFFTEDLNFTERLRTIIASLPNEIGEHTTFKLKEMEGMTDPKARIELLKSIEQALKKEKKEEQERAKEAKSKEKAEEAKMEKVLEEAAANVQNLHDVAAKTKAVEEQPGMVTEAAAQKVKDTKAKEKLDPALLESLENLLHGSPEQEVKHDITELKEKVIEHTEDLMEVGAFSNDYVESRGSKKLREKVHRLISKVDLLAATLEGRRREIKETVADPALTGSIESKKERLVHIKDLIGSLGKLQQVTEDVKRIEEILVAMDADVDGKLEADLILEVLDLVSKHKGVDINAKEMNKLVELLKKEDMLEELEHRFADGYEEAGQSQPLEEAVNDALPKLSSADEFPVRSMAPEEVSSHQSSDPGHPQMPPPPPEKPVEKSSLPPSG